MGYSPWGRKEPNMTEQVGTHTRGLYATFYTSPQLRTLLPLLEETWVRFLGHKDPLEEAMETHSSILAWEIPRTEEPGGLQSTGSQRVGHD